MIWFSGSQNGDIQTRVQFQSKNTALKVMMIFHLAKETARKLLIMLAFRIMFMIGVNTIHPIFHRQLFWLGIVILAISITVINILTETGVSVSGIEKWRVMILIVSVQQLVKQRVNTKRMYNDMRCGNSRIACTMDLPFTIPGRVIQSIGYDVINVMDLWLHKANGAKHTHFQSTWKKKWLFIWSDGNKSYKKST